MPRLLGVKDVTRVSSDGLQSQLEERDIEEEKSQLHLLETAINNPETLHMQSVSKAFRGKFSDAEREKIWERRSLPRKRRDDSFIELMETISNLEENRKILESLEKFGKPTRQTLKILRGKISNAEKKIPKFVRQITDASQELASLLTTPFPGVDQFLAREQETVEIRVERLKRVLTDAGITAASLVVKVGPLTDKVRRVISLGTGVLQSTLEFGRSYEDRMAKLLAESNIDTTSAEAVRNFSDDQKSKVGKIAEQAVLDAVATFVSIEAARFIAKKADLGFFDERAVRGSLKKTDDETFDIIFPEKE